MISSLIGSFYYWGACVILIALMDLRYRGQEYHGDILLPTTARALPYSLSRWRRAKRGVQTCRYLQRGLMILAHALSAWAS
ncbi:hypothetical protein N7528_006013 [Penicillium herquei]|nr:hypothetical protein N7528_006013 [Penicillium herquei]